MNKFDEQTLADPALHQLKVFMADVSSQLVNTDVRSFIKLYKSLGTDKLADFLGTTEEDVIEMMMLTKSSTRKLRWQSGGLLEGEVINTSDLDFNIDDVSVMSHKLSPCLTPSTSDHDQCCRAEGRSKIRRLVPAEWDQNARCSEGHQGKATSPPCAAFHSSKSIAAFSRDKGADCATGEADRLGSSGRALRQYISTARLQLWPSGPSQVR